MQIAILLYDRFTVLDAIGPYQVLSGLPGAEVVFVAEHPGLIRDEVGSLILSAGAGLPDVPRPDIVVVPGGPGQTALRPRSSAACALAAAAADPVAGRSMTLLAVRISKTNFP
jgi:putative intracellular protease/amidase